MLPLQFNDCNSRVLRATEQVQWNKFNIPSLSVPQLTNLDKEYQFRQSEFLTVKSKKKSQKEDASQPENSPVSTCKEDTTYNQNERHLYSCPEPGCIKHYQHFSSLQRHLDCGKYKRELEKETLFDRAATGYAESSLAAFLHYRHSKVQNHQGSTSFPWAGPSNVHK